VTQLVRLGSFVHKLLEPALAVARLPASANRPACTSVSMDLIEEGFMKPSLASLAHAEIPRNAASVDQSV
jgi:hypothetical protein